MTTSTPRVSRPFFRRLALAALLSVLPSGCGARTGLDVPIPEPPPDTAVTQVCRSGWCLTEEWCRIRGELGAEFTTHAGWDIVCLQGAPDATGIRRRDCLVPEAPGRATFCEQLHRLPDGRFALGVPVDDPIEIWAHDGSEARLFCASLVEPEDPCDGFITPWLLAHAPDACLFSERSWEEYWDMWPGTTFIPFPWDGGTRFVPFDGCGADGTSTCPSAVGAVTATTRTGWCGPGATEDRYSCAYATLGPTPFPGTTLDQLRDRFECPKAELQLQPRFLVAGDDPDPSAAAGRLGGPYCNMWSPRPTLGRLPAPAANLFFPDRPPFAAPLTMYALRNTTCEAQAPNAGFVQPILDPGIAAGGQWATVLDGSTLTVTRDEVDGVPIGPPASMGVEGDVAVSVGGVGSFAVTDFQLTQVDPDVGIVYVDPQATFTVTRSLLRMTDIWSGTYSPDAPPGEDNVTLTAHASSTSMSFLFDGAPWSMPLAPDRSPTGIYDGADHLALDVHYHDEPDKAQFDLHLELQLHPRPTAAIDSAEVAPGCRVLSDGRIGSVLTVSGHASAGTTLWQLLPQLDTEAPAPDGLTLQHASGTTAVFEVPLSPPSDPDYALSFTVFTGGQSNQDMRTGLAVRDTTGPAFETVSVAPSCLWPPNHGYAIFRLGEEVQATATDECSPAVRVRISNVVSDQPDRGLGSGNTSDDVLFGDTGFCIRSERSGSTSGPRRYTITLEATDSSGNVSTYDTVVEIHHDQRPPRCSDLDPDAYVADEDVATTCVFADVPLLPPPPSVFDNTGAFIPPPPPAALPVGSLEGQLCSASFGAGRSSAIAIVFVAAIVLLGRRRSS